MASAAESAIVHLVVGEALARPGKDRRVAGETLILLVLPVGEKPGVNRIGRTVRLDDGNAHDYGHGQPRGRCKHGRTCDNKRPLTEHQSAVYLRIEVTRPANRRRC